MVLTVRPHPTEKFSPSEVVRYHSARGYFDRIGNKARSCTRPPIRISGGMVKIVRGVVKNRLRASIAILGCAALVLPPLARRVGASSSEATLVIDYPSERS